VLPDTAGIGTPFRVIVRVRAPRGSVITFPTGPDSGGPVEALDPPLISAGTDTSAVDQTATYRLAAWDLGRQVIGLPPVEVRTGDTRRMIPLAGLALTVRGIVPARGGGRTPKDARPLFPDPRPLWWWWAMAALALAAVGLVWLVVRWWRRRSRRRPVLAPAHERAIQELDDLDRLGLIDAGEAGRYVALLNEIVRTYLARRIPAASLSATTHELLAALNVDGRVPTEHLRGFLTETDLVKFARLTPTADRARQVGTMARELVTGIDSSIEAAEIARREAAARQESEELEARRAARARGIGGRAA
jgi:hypothetical protein